MECKRIAEGVYALGNSPYDPLTPLVKEALQVPAMLGYTCMCGGQVEVLVMEYDEPVDDLILYYSKTSRPLY